MHMLQFFLANTTSPFLCRKYNRYYYDETMTSILKEVGFKDIKWHPLEILTDEQFEAREKFEKALPDIILRVLTAVKE